MPEETVAGVGPARGSRRRATVTRLAAVAVLLTVSACGGESREAAPPAPVPPPTASTAPTPAPSPGPTASSDPAPAAPPVDRGLPGMPPVLDPSDVYAANRAGLDPSLQGVPERVYVPNGRDGTVTVINARTRRVERTFPAGQVPQHVVPSYDLKTLWVNSSGSNTVTRIDPVTGRPRGTLQVDDPYNLYFTPDGRFAMVIAERMRRIDFRDPRTMALRGSMRVPCVGANHLDFSADGRWFLLSCEFSGELMTIDTVKRRVIGKLRLPPGSKPQDVKLAPDGRVFYVADLNQNGLHVVKGPRPRVTGFVRTAAGAHGLYVSRDSRDLYVTNRSAGSVSVVDLATSRVRRTWRLPAGASPDMGNTSVDGTTLWLASRYGSWVDALDVRSGKHLARVRVGSGPHGLTVWPQPGRYSLGHTGILR